MAAFLQNLDDADLPPADRLALAVSGWLLGADAATVKLGAAMSAYHVRQTIRAYLNETVKPNRAEPARTMHSEEAATLASAWPSPGRT